MKPSATIIPLVVGLGSPLVQASVLRTVPKAALNHHHHHHENVSSPSSGNGLTNMDQNSTAVGPRSQGWPLHKPNKYPAGGYFESCLECKMFDKYECGRGKGEGSRFQCECDYEGRPGGFRRRVTAVDLNQKLGNVQGKLTWAAPNAPCGGYRHSCKCELLEGRYLSCECRDAGGATEVVDLNEHIANRNGFLKVLP